MSLGSQDTTSQTSQEMYAKLQTFLHWGLGGEILFVNFHFIVKKKINPTCKGIKNCSKKHVPTQQNAV